MLMVYSCSQPKEMSSISVENWHNRDSTAIRLDSMESGRSYLSVYSQIYSLSEHRQHDLTATFSIRNMSR
jgi:hypothetical protein